jgi:hypothetical protein
MLPAMPRLRTLLLGTAVAAATVTAAPAAAYSPADNPHRGLYHVNAGDSEWVFNYTLPKRYSRGPLRGIGEACVRFGGVDTPGVAVYDKPREGMRYGETRVVLSAVLGDGRVFEMWGAFDQAQGGKLWYRGFAPTAYGFERIGSALPPGAFTCGQS